MRLHTVSHTLYLATYTYLSFFAIVVTFDLYTPNTRKRAHTNTTFVVLVDSEELYYHAYATRPSQFVFLSLIMVVLLVTCCLLALRLLLLGCLGDTKMMHIIYMDFLFRAQSEPQRGQTIATAIWFYHDSRNICVFFSSAAKRIVIIYLVCDMFYWFAFWT